MRLRRFLRDHGLSLVMLALFVVFLVGQALTGWAVHNDMLREHGRHTVAFGLYLGSGHFLEAVSENWESEFLQMGAFVLLSAFFYERGSAESNDPDDPDRIAKTRSELHSSLRSRLYRHSLSLSLFGLFAFSFVVHALSGTVEHNEEALRRDQAPLSVWQFLGSATFWFQSLQNWQSEFLSVGLLVILSIYLRERGSSQSKPVGAARAQTGV